MPLSNGRVINQYIDFASEQFYLFLKSLQKCRTNEIMDIEN